MCRTWNELTPLEKINVAMFVEKKIERIQNERYAIGVYIENDSLLGDTPSIDRTDDENLIEAYCVNYFCEECQETILEDDNGKDLERKMIEHVIEHHLEHILKPSPSSASRATCAIPTR